jgi:hypothetical protein
MGDPMLRLHETHQWGIAVTAGMYPLRTASMTATTNSRISGEQPPAAQNRDHRAVTASHTTPSGLSELERNSDLLGVRRTVRSVDNASRDRAIASDELYGEMCSTKPPALRRIVWLVEPALRHSACKPVVSR